MKTERLWLPIVVVAGSFVGGGLAALLLSARFLDPHRVIRAERFEIVDALETQRASFSVRSDGQAVVALFDAQGKQRAALYSNDEAAGLELFDERGEPCACFAGVPEGPASINFINSKGICRAALGTDEEGEPSLAIYDAEERLRASFGLDSKGEPAMTIHGQNEELRAALGMGAGQTGLHLFDDEQKKRGAFFVHDSGSALQLYDAQEKCRSMIGASSDGEGALSVLDREERIRGSIWGDADGTPHVELADQDEKPVWEAP